MLSAGRVTWSEHYATVFGRAYGVDDSWQWWIDRIHPEDRDRTSKSLVDAINGTGFHWREEYRFKLASGDWRTFMTSLHIAR